MEQDSPLRQNPTESEHVSPLRQNPGELPKKQTRTHTLNRG